MSYNVQGANRSGTVPSGRKELVPGEEGKRSVEIGEGTRRIYEPGGAGLGLLLVETLQEFIAEKKKDRITTLIPKLGTDQYEEVLKSILEFMWGSEDSRKEAKVNVSNALKNLEVTDQLLNNLKAALTHERPECKAIGLWLVGKISVNIVTDKPNWLDDALKAEVNKCILKETRVDYLVLLLEGMRMMLESDLYEKDTMDQNLLNTIINLRRDTKFAEKFEPEVKRIEELTCSD